ncbi:MAG: hypothetical protein M0009_03905 [Deltaproteobacteria bacterium]|nr:hypothetical protein [Deltaproteobacteria bacterium]
MKTTISGLRFPGVLFIFVALLLLFLPASGRADCPDRVTCYMKVYNGFTYDSIWKGNLSTPTCWKIGHQCAPWNCSGNSMTSDDLVNECIRRFKLKAAHEGEKACIVIPELPQMEHSLNGFHEHCNELPFTGLFSPLSPAVY